MQIGQEVAKEYKNTGKQPPDGSNKERSHATMIKISWSIRTFIKRLEEVNKKKTRATTTRKLHHAIWWP